MFGFNDIITGNSSNTYGKTNEFGEYKVTGICGNNISVEVLAHVESGLIGKQFHGLDATQFKFLRAGAPVKSKPTEPRYDYYEPTRGYVRAVDQVVEKVSESLARSSKRFNELTTVYVRDLAVYKSAATRTQAGSTARILSYDDYLPAYNCWECTVMFGDGTIGVMVENEMSSSPTTAAKVKAYDEPRYTRTVHPEPLIAGFAPVDDDYWHDDPRAGKKAPIKEEYIYPETKKVAKEDSKKPKQPAKVIEEPPARTEGIFNQKVKTFTIKSRRTR